MLVVAFNQEKALVGAFSVIVKTGCGTDGALHSTMLKWCNNSISCSIWSPVHSDAALILSTVHKCKICLCSATVDWCYPALLWLPSICIQCLTIAQFYYLLSGLGKWQIPVLLPFFTLAFHEVKLWNKIIGKAIFKNWDKVKEQDYKSWNISGTLGKQ